MERSSMAEGAVEILTPDEIDSMVVPLTGLLDSHGWGVYQEILKRYRIQARESFESAEDMASVAFIRGVIQGLTIASKAPDEIIEVAERRHKREDADIRARQMPRGFSGQEGEESF